MTAGQPIAAPKNSGSKDAAPSWASLTPRQQQALQPLAGAWPSINVGQKRKWLEVSKNFSAMPAAEQSKLHSHMASWAALSTEQRAQARLNFAKANQLSGEEKKAKWQAYQNLSTEEKQRLVATAAPKPGAAASVKPVAPNKLTKVPLQNPVTAVSVKPGERSTPPPKIAAAPHQVDSNTLLPQQVPVTGALPHR